MIFSLLTIKSLYAAFSISSSGKSMLATIRACIEISSSFNSFKTSLKAPPSWFNPMSKETSVFAFIISITASAWVRSILPFKNPLLVNSPLSASLAPFDKTKFKILLTETIPPWQWTSTISSAV